jgi:hypothetical protein
MSTWIVLSASSALAGPFVGVDLGLVRLRLPPGRDRALVVVLGVAEPPVERARVEQGAELVVLPAVGEPVGERAIDHLAGVVRQLGLGGAVEVGLRDLPGEPFERRGGDLRGRLAHHPVGLGLHRHLVLLAFPRGALLDFPRRLVGERAADHALQLRRELCRQLLVVGVSARQRGEHLVGDFLGLVGPPRRAGVGLRARFLELLLVGDPRLAELRPEAERLTAALAALFLHGQLVVAFGDLALGLGVALDRLRADAAEHAQPLGDRRQVGARDRGPGHAGANARAEGGRERHQKLGAGSTRRRGGTKPPAP